MYTCKDKNKEFDKFDISGFINNTGLEKKIKALVTKAELNAEQDESVKLQTHYVSYFLGKNFFGDDDFHKYIFKYVGLLANI